MNFEELKSLYEDKAYNPIENEELTGKQKAEVMTDDLEPKEIIKMALSRLESLHYTPDSNEVSSLEALREYFYNQLIK